jgi:hypothetical protein
MTETKIKRCVLCGSTNNLEMNHPAGRNLVPSFTLPYCKRHHDLFHIAVKQAGIAPNRTDNPLVRFIRAMKMLLVAAWQVIDQLEADLQREGKEH